MKREHGVVRPKDLLDGWLDRYGYRDNRIMSDDAGSACYLFVRRYDDDNEPFDEWLLAGIGADPHLALVDAFRSVLRFSNEEYGRGKFATTIEGIVLLSFGYGVWVAETEGGERVDLDSLDDDDVVALAVEAGVVSGEVPCRVVNVITPSGLAGEVTMFRGDDEPMVEVVEQYLHDGEGTIPKPLGAVDDALIKLFTVTLMVRDVVVNDLPMNPASLITVAMSPDFGDQARGYMMSVVGEALQKGLFSFDDD